MSGRMPAAYHRAYQARRRAEGRPLRRRPGYVRPARVRDLSAEYARRRCERPVDLAPLRPDLQRGAAVSYWEDELRLDLAQEAELARLEHRSAADRVAAYRARETSWHAITVPLVPEA